MTIHPEPTRRPVPVATFATEESVYGIILVAGMIVVTGLHEASAWSTFWVVDLTVLVFWAAHVYAGTLARYGASEDGVEGFREAFRDALGHSFGLLAAALIPSVILLLGATRIFPDDVATWLALWSGVVVLGVLGYLAFARRTPSIPRRIVGAVATAMFGVAMIALKALVH